MKTDFRQARQRRRGSALLVAVSFMGALAILAAMVLQQVSARRTLWNDMHQHSKAVALAEAGVETVLVEMRRDRAYKGEEHTPLGEGSFSVAVVPSDKPGGYRIESAGVVGDESFAHAKARLVIEARFDSQGNLHTVSWREERGS